MPDTEIQPILPCSSRIKHDSSAYYTTIEEDGIERSEPMRVVLQHVNIAANQLSSEPLISELIDNCAVEAFADVRAS